MRRYGFKAAIAFMGVLAMAGAAMAAEGQAVGVDPDAVARLTGGDRVLTVGADISLGEEIVTGPSGQVQIVFSDKTRLVVGPGSALMIESYLFAGNSAEKFAINALAGSFRFITGNSPKPAYSITTPTASIAVRGTEFDFNVSSRRTDLLLYEGAVRLCSGGACADIVSRCELGVAQAGEVNTIGHADPEHPPLSQEFRYALFQSPLLSTFRVSGAGQCTEPPRTSAPAESLSPTTGGNPSLPTRVPPRN